MRVAIIGGQGFLGRLLTQRLLQCRTLTGAAGEPREIDDLIAIDQIAPVAPVAGVRSVTGDIAEPDFLEQAIGDGVECIFHLASVVSAAAEADFDLGMRVNLDATRGVLETCRKMPKPPRLVFTSSLAVFGAAPSVVEDDTPAWPLSSYGMQKVVGEYLACEYSRRGFVDARCVRLPTIVIRPGKPNRAASSFVSAILRDPLQGLAATCPVDADLALWIQSPRVVIGNLMHALELPADRWASGPRVLNLPGLTVTVRDMIDALERAGGDSSLIRWQPDPDIMRIVGSWPGAMNTLRATAMGFEKDPHIDRIIGDFVATLAAG
jgi:D-erythronate 2-dehydrogenase